MTTVTITSNKDAYDLRSVQGGGCSDPGVPEQTQARLVKLGTYFFADMSPRPEVVCDSCLAVHQFFLTSFTKDTISLTPIDADGLLAVIRAKKAKLSIVPVDLKGLFLDGPLTLTAPSKDLRAFCQKFGGNKSIFKPESAEVLKRTAD